MNSKTINDDMVDYIRSKPEGVNSIVLAESFLKFKKPENTMAQIAIKGILQKDKRCTLGSNGLWFVEKKYDRTIQQPICNIPWAVVNVLMGPSKVTEKILHLTIWSPFQTQGCLLSEWFINPTTLSYEEREMLASNYDHLFEGRDAVISRIVETLDNRTAIFLSSRQQRIINKYCSAEGEFLNDDTMLISQLFRILGMAVPKPIDLISCYKLLFNREPALSSACHYGEALSECVRELILRFPENGITTRNDLDLSEQKETLLADWGYKAFSLSDITSFPQLPGVYGFKDRNGKYIYIGKAKNLRRRLMSYFRNTEESPEKLKRLRQGAYDLTVYRCGSELESLIFEHRLIQKHRPAFNAKIEINERKGAYSPLQDCIILLPHAEKDKGMSFWFRNGQKILIKPLYTDLREAEGLLKQLEEFFFTEKLPADYTDFPEQEIVFRWVKKHLDSLSIVPVYRMGYTKEIIDTIKSYWESD
jgi:hypothetical protein